jgi:hypothetical protein
MFGPKNEEYIYLFVVYLMTLFYNSLFDIITCNV